MRPKAILTGLVSPIVLAEAEAHPTGAVASDIRACDCLEIRYDLFSSQDEWSSLSARVARLHPQVLRLGTIRLQRDGGNFDNGMASMRFPLWSYLLEAPVGLHFIDLELECARDYALLRSQAVLSGTRILLSQHHFDGIPPIGELESFVHEALRLEAPGFKISCMSHCKGDTAPLYEFTRKHSAQFEWFAAFAMGAEGQASRLYSLSCGANLTYGAIGEVLAPGQIQVGLMRRLLQDMDHWKDENEVRGLLREPA